MGVCGNAAELRKAADDLDVINAAGRAAYLEKAGAKLDETTLAEMMDKETWLTAEQCIQYGLADEFAERDADMAQAAEVLKKANLDIQQRIDVQRSLAAQLQQLTIHRESTGKEHHEPTGSIMQMFAGIFNA